MSNWQTVAHCFWHVVALAGLLLKFGPSEDDETASDAEWEWYVAFMRRHGFNSMPGAGQGWPK